MADPARAARLAQLAAAVGEPGEAGNEVVIPGEDDLRGAVRQALSRAR